MFAGLRKLIRGALFDASGTLSLSRCILLFVALEVTAITWLVVAWCWYVTANNLMEEAAPLASAVSTGAAAVLSAQVSAAAWQYFTQKKFDVTSATTTATTTEAYVAPPGEERREI